MVSLFQILSSHFRLLEYISVTCLSILLLLSLFFLIFHSYISLFLHLFSLLPTSPNITFILHLYLHTTHDLPILFLQSCISLYSLIWRHRHIFHLMTSIFLFPYVLFPLLLPYLLFISFLPPHFLYIFTLRIIFSSI